MKVTANPASAVDGGIPSMFHSARLWSAATDSRRSAVEVAIEKYEKTAMQWLQEQTQKQLLTM